MASSRSTTLCCALFFVLFVGLWQSCEAVSNPSVKINGEDQRYRPGVMKKHRERNSCGDLIPIKLPEVFAASCVECELAILAVRAVVAQNGSSSDIEKIATFFCDFMKIEDPHVCKDVIKEFGNTFLYLVENEALDPTVACSVVGYCPKPDYPKWNVTFPRPAPPVKPYPPVNPNGERVYVLHVTDIHVDSLYTPGLEWNCGEPICCRPPNPKGQPGNQAGVWGEYSCDAPKALYENMLQFIAQNLQHIDYAIFTGDIPPHDVWDITRDVAMQDENYVADTWKKYLPNLTLFPSVGNHESVPVNEFPTRDIKGKFDESWLYNTLADRWQYWLPADAVEQSRYAGYYTALSPDGVRIISLNTNLGCNNLNWWLTIPSNETADPDLQLHWLASVLDQAELNNETVYLIKHIAPSQGECQNDPWWTNYFKIINRYENIILGDFAGHTHDDIFSVTYAAQSDDPQLPFRPFVTTYFPGSVTPFSNENPGFRVYEIDKKTKAIVDFTEYAANLTLANIQGQPAWEITYTAKAAYSLPDMSPASWHQASLNMGTNNKLLLQYIDRMGKGAPRTCGKNCQHNSWCSLWVAPPGYENICGK